MTQFYQLTIVSGSADGGVLDNAVIVRLLKCDICRFYIDNDLRFSATKEAPLEVKSMSFGSLTRDFLILISSSSSSILILNRFRVIRDFLPAALYLRIVV